jgi:hypothetical protein
MRWHKIKMTPYRIYLVGASLSVSITADILAIIQRLHIYNQESSVDQCTSAFVRAKTFPHFPKLPILVQTKIWEMILPPPRVFTKTLINYLHGAKMYSYNNLYKTRCNLLLIVLYRRIKTPRPARLHI